MVRKPILRDEDWQLVFMRRSQHHVEQILAAHDQPVLVGVEMGGANAHRECALNLGAQFPLYVPRVDVFVVLPVMIEVSGFVDETRYFVCRSYWPPTVINS